MQEEVDGHYAWLDATMILVRPDQVRYCNRAGRGWESLFLQDGEGLRLLLLLSYHSWETYKVNINSCSFFFFF